MGGIYHNGEWYGGGQDIDIQSDPTATSFESGKVPDGGTCESVLNSILAWKFIGEATTNNGTVSVADTYNEYLLIFAIAGSNNFGSITVPKREIGNRGYFTVYESASNNAEVSFQYSTANQRFAFSQPFLRGWSTAKIMVYAR